MRAGRGAEGRAEQGRWGGEERLGMCQGRRNNRQETLVSAGCDEWF